MLRKTTSLSTINQRIDDTKFLGHVRCSCAKVKDVRFVSFVDVTCSEGRRRRVRNVFPQLVVFRTITKTRVLVFCSQHPRSWAACTKCLKRKSSLMKRKVNGRDMPRWVRRQKSNRGTFLMYFWTSNVRNELDGGSLFHTNTEFFHAVAVMDKFGGWEEEKEDEHQIGARLVACMWIYTTAAISLRQRTWKTSCPNCFRLQRHSTRRGTFFVGLTNGYKKSSVEPQERKIMWFLQIDIESP